MRYNDDGDLDRILELFEPDAAYQVMGRVLIGQQQIGEFLEARGFSHDRPAWTDPGQLLNQTRSTHISSNPIIDLHGDTATVESDFQVARRDSDGRARIVLLGRYRDEVRRGSDGKWRLYTRTGDISGPSRRGVHRQRMAESPRRRGRMSKRRPVHISPHLNEANLHGCGSLAHSDERLSGTLPDALRAPRHRREPARLSGSPRPVSTGQLPLNDLSGNTSVVGFH